MSSIFEYSGNDRISSLESPFAGDIPSATKIQYERTMNREGKTATTYTGGTEFRCFFRTKEDSENEKETTYIYYDITAPVRPGTMICYGYGVFLVLNRETVENDVYYKSTVVKCNGTYTNLDNYQWGTIPFYSDNLQSTLAIGNSVIQTLSGNLEFITEDNELSRKIDINHRFNEFNRSFRVTNRWSIDGITHIVAEVTTNVVPTYEYTIVIDGVPTENITVGSTFKLSATGYCNGAITSGGTFEWVSSDNTVATIDGTGKVTTLKDGTVSFTATWVEHIISSTTEVLTVGSAVTPSTYRAVITCSSTTIYAGGSAKKMTAKLFDGSDTEITDTTWEFTVDYVHPNYLTITYPLPNQVSVKVSDDAMDDYGEVITVTAMEKYTGHTATYTLEVSSYY